MIQLRCSIVVGIGVCAPLTAVHAQYSLGVTTCFADLGLVPEPLAASGMSPAEVDAAMQRVAGATAEREALGQARADLSQASEEKLLALERYWADPEDNQAVSDYHTAQARADAAAAAIAAGRTSLWALIVADLDGERLTRLNNMRLSSQYDVPAPYRCLPWTAEELRQLQAALLQERVILRDGGELDDSHAQLLDAVRQLAAVIESRSDLALNVDAVEQVFEFWATGS